MTFAPNPRLDEKNFVVFGEALQGRHILRKLQSIQAGLDGTPGSKVWVSQCREVAANPL